MNSEHIYILKEYNLTKAKNIKCKAYTPISAAKKLANYIITKTKNNLSFSIQNKDTKKIYEYVLRWSESGFIVKPNKTTIGGGINKLPFAYGMHVVLRVQDEQNGYLTLDTNDDSMLPNNKGMKLTIKPNISEKSIFIISPHERFNTINANFVNMVQDKFQLKYHKNASEVFRYFNIVSIPIGLSLYDYTPHYSLTKHQTNYEIHDNNETYYLDLSFHNLPNVEIIPYYNYGSFSRTVTNRETGNKSYISKNKHH
jgi:hypothetical protein